MMKANFQDLHSWHVSKGNDCPAELREKLSLESQEELTQWRHTLSPMHREDDRQDESGNSFALFYLKTCHRVEFYYSGIHPKKFEEHLQKRFGTLTKHLQHSVGGENIARMIRICSGMDSAVLGETQISKQFKDAIENAFQLDLLNPAFHKMLQEILRSAKKIRTESQLGYGAMSVAHVAIDGLSDFYESLSNKSALVVGAGHMATLALKKLLQHNIQQVTWINRNLERINNHPFSEFIKTEPLEKLPELFWQNRITVLATSARDPLLNREILEMSRPRGACLKRFSHENHVVLDLGLPRNASTDLQDLENVYVRDVDEFQDRRDKHLNKKLQALKLAEDLLQEEVHRFQDLQLQWAKRDIKKDLIRSFEYMKNQELSNLKLEKSEKIGYIVNGAYGRILHRLIAQVDELDAHNAQRFVKELIAAFKDSPELMLGGRESNNQDSSPEG